MDRAADTTRFLFFLVALALYGLLGSPTPGAMGWVEWGVGLLLLAAIPVRNLTSLFSFLGGDEGGTLWRSCAQFLLLYGFCVPLVMGLMAGHDPVLIIRDLIGFLFLLLPLFFLPSASMSIQRLWPVVAMVGVFFALRVIVFDSSDPLYLSIAPSIVFAAIILAAKSEEQLLCGLSLRRLVLAGALIALSVMCFAALAATVQRASLVLSAGGLIFLLILVLWRRPGRAVIPFLLCIVMVLAFHSPLGDILDALARKQNTVGLNMRLQEAAAVFDAITPSPFHVLFGLGWGGQLESPAVGGMLVNYTHSLLTFMWLKTGLVGLLGVVLYLWAFLVVLLQALPKYPVFVVALAVPLVIDSFLYASFKSLDFGLILLLCAALGRGIPRAGAVASGPDLVYR